VFSPAWEIADRLRARLILRDLELPESAPGLPLCPAMPPLHTRPQLLGTMYVLESIKKCGALQWIYHYRHSLNIILTVPKSSRDTVD